MHLVPDNKLLVVCKIDKELWQADLKGLLFPVNVQAFTDIYNLWGVWYDIVEIPFDYCLIFYSTFLQSLTAVTHVFSLVLLHAI